MGKLLIVGGGLAGAILATEAKSRGMDFKWMISENIPAASFAAYGICNPVQFRNKVPAWRADEFLSISKSFFTEQEEKLGIKLVNELPVHHIIVEEQELVQWRQNVESTSLWKYASGELETHLLPIISNGFLGSILINKAFFVSIGDFVLAVRKRFETIIEWNNFDATVLSNKGDNWEYNSQVFEHVIFCEGVHGYSNPYFTRVPFNPCKGETLVVKIPGFTSTFAIHKKVVLIPIGNEHFILGATYSWDELNFESSIKGRNELEMALQEIIGDKYTFEVIEQKAGVRPSMSDRRPVVGWHPLHKGIGILNGFGSMGLMVGPSAAKNLLENLENGTPILPDWDINRFKKRLLNPQ